MKFFIVGEIVEKNRNYNDEVISEMCEAIRYQYSDNHNSKDESIEIYTLDTFSTITPINTIQRALNYLDDIDKIVFISGYESSKCCRIIYDIAHEYVDNKILHPDDLNKIIDDYRKGKFNVSGYNKDKKARKIFISQPLTGIPEETSTAQRLEAEEALRYYYKDEDLQFIHHTEKTAPKDVKSKRLWYLGESITILANADAIAFLPGWESSLGCRIEFTISDEYKIEPIIGREMDEILKEYRERHPLYKADTINTMAYYPNIQKIELN